MPNHSTIGLGGSTADRWLNCAGHYQAILALPPSIDRPSEYAEEGTAMHAVKAQLMIYRQHCEARGTEYTPHAIARGYVDDAIIFHDRALTSEHLDTMIFPALAALEKLEADYGGDFKVLAVEKAVKFPGIPGAFGTCDLILSNAAYVLHVDWKFGSGIQVVALYEDPAGDIVNPQVMFYITAAVASARHFYKGNKTLVGCIIQPRGDIPLSHTTISRKEIRYFTEDLQKAVTAAMQRDPPRRKGEWCRFASCKSDCPLWTAPLLQGLELGAIARTEMVSDQLTPYGRYLAEAKTIADMAGLWKKEIDEQLHAYLQDGGAVPGWRLKAKVKQRKWIDEKIVAKSLTELGFSHDEIWGGQLQTFASTDATAKRRGVEIPANLRVAPPTDETTICRTDDPAPVIVKPLAIEQFRAALQAIRR